MTTDRPSVVVSHPGTQQVYETVAGLQRAGMLNRFLASAYWTDDAPERRSPWRWLPPSQRAKAIAGLRKRRHEAIDPAFVNEMPLPFLVMRGLASTLSAAGLRQYSGVERLGDAWFDRRAASWLERELRAVNESRTDRSSGLSRVVTTDLSRPSPINRAPISQVHAFEGDALHTFDAARRLGLRTVLDVPAAHEYNIALCDEEAREAHIAPPKRFGSSSRIARERALADVIVSPSAFVTRCLTEHDVPAEKIVEIPFGADIERFTPAPASERPERFTLLYVASINARKGTRYLLEAWRRLALPDAELILTGAPDAFGERLLREYDGTFRHLGHVPWFELPALFRSASAFVLPSLAEGSALVTYMAMASGLPVIVTEDAGAVARDQIDGHVIPSRDVAALERAITALYEQPRTAADMGASGRHLIASRYTWRHYHDRIAALHQSLYDNHSVPADGARAPSPATERALITDATSTDPTSRAHTPTAWGIQL